jgi:hypothetical protein
MTAELLDDLAQTFRVFFDDWRASSNRDDLGVVGSSLSGNCSSRGFTDVAGAAPSIVRPLIVRPLLSYKSKNPRRKFRLEKIPRPGELNNMSRRQNHAD